MKNAIRLTLTAVLGILGVQLHAQVPQELPYQGRVLVQGTNFNGSGNFKFVLMNAGGTVTYWSNDGTSAAGSEPTAGVPLTVDKGLFGLLLGDTGLANMTALPSTVFTNEPLVLRVWFNDGTTGYQVLSPDQALGAVGYAHVAAYLQGGQADANDTTNELNTGFSLNGNSLDITDAGATLSVDLSGYDDSAAIGAASNALTAVDTSIMTTLTTTRASVAANSGLITGNRNATDAASNALASADAALATSLGTASNALRTDLTAHVSADNDLSAANELNTAFSLNGNSLDVTDAGGTLSVDLSGYDDGAAIAAASNALTAVDTSIMTTLTTTRASVAANSGLITGNRNATDAASNALQTAISAHVSADNDLSAANELNTAFSLNGNSLDVTDAGGTLSVDLSGYDDGAAIAAASNALTAVDTSIMTTLTTTRASVAANSGLITGNRNATDAASNALASADAALATSLGTASNALRTDLTAHVSADNDLSAANELNTAFSLNGNSLDVTDAGGTLSVDLSGYDDGAAIAAASNALTAVDTSIMTTLTTTRASVAANSGLITGNRNATDAASNALQTAISSHVSADNDLSAANELNTAFSLNGNSLDITDAGATLSVDLSGYDNSASVTANRSALNAASNGLNGVIGIASNALRTDLQAHITADGDLSAANELNTALSLNGSTLEITDAGGMLTADLSTLSDADGNPSNELNTAFSLNGNSLDITDAGATLSVNLSGYDDSAAISAASNALTVVDAALASDKLNRDGTQPMTGDLDLGGNSVTNIEDIVVPGTTGRVGIGTKTTTQTSRLRVERDTFLQALHTEGGIRISGGDLTLVSGGSTSVYVNLDTVFGTPPSSDCSDTSHYGRVIIDSTTTGTFYYCAADGWQVAGGGAVGGGGSFLPLDGSSAMTGDLDMGGFSITNVSPATIRYNDGNTVRGLIAASSNALRSSIAGNASDITANRSATDAASNSLASAGAALETALNTASNVLRTDLAAHISGDNDLSAANELNTAFSLNGNSLDITDAGATLSVDLSGYDDSSSLAAASNALTAVDTSIMTTLTTTRTSVTANSGLITGNRNAVDATSNGVVNAMNTASNALRTDLTAHLSADEDLSGVNELNTAVSLNGTTLEVTDAGGTKSASLAGLLNTAFSLNGNSLDITDAGATLSVDLSGYDDSAAVTANRSALNAASNGLNTAIGTASNALQSSELSRDGAEPMTGDLNLGGQSVTNIADIVIPGTTGRVGIGTKTTAQTSRLRVERDTFTSAIHTEGGILAMGGDVRAASPAGTNAYIQADWESGAPPGSDCNDSTHFGRIYVDALNDVLYFCTDDGWQTN